MTTIFDLLVYIRSHDTVARIRNGQLQGLCEWTKRRDDGTIEAGSQWETIEPTLEAVRNWLGY